MRNLFFAAVIIVMWAVTAIALWHDWCAAVVLAVLSAIVTCWILERVR